MDKQIYIYGLFDPRRPFVFCYVGKANNVAHRLRWHIYSGREGAIGNTSKLRWLRELAAVGIKPEITIIEEVTTENWQQRERYWIRFYRAVNPNLLNISEGGNGAAVVAAETRRRMAAAHIGKTHSLETRLAIGAGQIGNKRGPETGLKISAKLKGQRHFHTAESRAKMSKAQQGRVFSKETILNMKAAAVLRFAKHGPNKGMLGRKHSAETRLKMRQSNLKNRGLL